MQIYKTKLNYLKEKEKLNKKVRMMETLCKIRDILRSIIEFEAKFQQKFGLCLNEGMLLCTLQSGKLSSKELAGTLGLTYSNTSKVIKSVERKGLIKRILGKSDRRMMYFSLTAKGNEILASIQDNPIETPEQLREIATTNLKF